VLLTGAGLLLQSLWRLESVPLGIDVQNVVTAEITLPEYHYQHDSQRLAFFNQLQTQVKRIPGVSSVALSDWLPPAGLMQADHLLEYRNCRTAAHTARNWRHSWIPPGEPRVFFDVGN